MMAISSRSCAASSARPPLSYSSTDSWRCLIIFWNTPRRSASDSGGLPSPRAAMSAFLMVELTMRSVESLRSSFALIASLTALVMSSRSIDLTSRNFRARWRFFESSSRSIFLFEHDLFGKPVPTFPDHALGPYDRSRTADQPGQLLEAAGGAGGGELDPS